MTSTTTNLTPLFEFLRRPSVSSLFKSHPNDIQSGLTPVPDSWSEWWLWAESNSSLEPAKLLLDYYYYYSDNGDGETVKIPELLRTLLDDAKILHRRRDPIYVPPSHHIRQRKTLFGQSPKKIHEVEQMVSYIDLLLDEIVSKSSETYNGFAKLRIVDVGSGQGYLTRSLAHFLRSKYPTSSGKGKRILAIDSDEHQTNGAKLWENKSHRGKKSRLSERFGEDKNEISEEEVESLIQHETICLTAPKLLCSVDEWISHSVDDDTLSIPVLFVGLHACGSLTPNILKSVMAAGHRGGSTVMRTNRTWHCIGAVVVGCCYNLLEPQDFPMSAKLKQQFLTVSRSTELQHPILPSSAYHLATQTPGTYYLTEQSKTQFHLSVKKVVWRALLSEILSNASSSDHRSLAGSPTDQSEPLYSATDGTPRPKHTSRMYKLNAHGTGDISPVLRLGKLNDKVYHSWYSFLEAVSAKTQISSDENHLEDRSKMLLALQNLKKDVRRESQLAVLQVLRCLLGPVVETLLLEDRICWVREQMEVSNGVRFQVKLVNLFDQSTGSGRNVGVVIAPSIPGLYN